MIKFDDNKPLIYVAGKYTGNTYSEVEDNIQKARIAGIELLKKGWAVYIPHMNTAHFDSLGIDKFNWQLFMDINLSILKRCDAIFLLKGWHTSNGANVEQEYSAKNPNIQIFYEDTEYPEPISL